MTTLLWALLAGYLAARLVWLSVRPVLAHPALARVNFRGRPVPTAAGIVLPVAALAVEGGRTLAGSLGVGAGAGLSGGRALVLLAAVGFALLGLVDDLAGGGSGADGPQGDARGFRGHLGALVGGRPTTGALKLFGGAALALALAGPYAGDSPGRLVTDAALVALAANLANLFDRAPGRTVKAGLAALALLAALAGRRPALAPAAMVVGACLGLFLDDLHERLMLGDTGSNVVGAVLGLGAVMALAPGGRDLALLAVAALNVAGEVVSFSRVIEALPPLRALDRAGRLP